MLHKGTCVPDVSVLDPSRLPAALLIAIVLFVSPGAILAQRGAGGGAGAAAGGGRNTMPIICVHDCPALREGLSSDDSLKNFRRAMAIQATPEQRAAFAKIAQYAEQASDQLLTFRQSLQPSPAASALSDRVAALDDAVAKARAGHLNFVTALSAAQKSGLKDVTAKLEKADSDLDKQIKTFDQIVHTPKPDTEPIAASAANLEKALAGFRGDQLELGREMSILFPPVGEDVAFSLPAVTQSVAVDGKTILIPSSGAVSRGSVTNGLNLFTLQQVADLSDLQQNIVAILRAELFRAPRCGERIDVLDASLTPLAPASLVVATVRYERWICPPGSVGATELASSNGQIEVKLTPTLEPGGSLHLLSEISRVDADGLLRNALRSGDLGVKLRDQIAAALTQVIGKAADLKATLPLAARQSATLQKLAFESVGPDQLGLILDGQLQLSDEQTQQFAAQLKQSLAAQANAP